LLIGFIATAMGAPRHLAADCPNTVQVRFGGQSGGALGFIGLGGAKTVVDLSRPAREAIDVSRIDFSYPSIAASSFSIRFVVVRPAGTQYTVIAQSADLPFSTSSSGIFSASLPQPLHFEAGDLLGSVTTGISTADLGYSLAENPGGFAVVAAAVGVGSSFDRLSFANEVDSSVAVSMEAFGAIPCAKVPPLEVIVPVGDVVGGGDTHYRSNLDVFMNAIDFSGNLEIGATLRDRVATPGSVHVVTATSTAAIVNEPFHSDSIAEFLGATPPFFGTLAVAFPFTQGFTQNWENNAAVSSTISAATSACSGGGTGSTLKAVGCRGIGRRFLVPFHVSPNHRLNIGIASAQLASCGVTVPAKSITIRVLQPIPGSLVTVPMPGESTQLNNVTSPGSPVADAIGLTDGIFEIRVADEASRILVYTVFQDNTSQDTAAAYALVDY
jgi:hypothetical protein